MATVTIEARTVEALSNQICRHTQFGDRVAAIWKSLPPRPGANRASRFVSAIPEPAGLSSIVALQYEMMKFAPGDRPLEVILSHIESTVHALEEFARQLRLDAAENPDVYVEIPVAELNGRDDVNLAIEMATTFTHGGTPTDSQLVVKAKQLESLLAETSDDWCSLYGPASASVADGYRTLTPAEQHEVSVLFNDSTDADIRSATVVRDLMRAIGDSISLRLRVARKLGESLGRVGRRGPAIDAKGGAA